MGVLLLTIGSTDMVLVKYNSAGSVLWTSQTGTNGNAEGEGASLSADEQFIYVAGSASNSLNGQPYAGGDDPSLAGILLASHLLVLSITY